MKNTAEQINWEEKYYKSEQKIVELEALIKFYEEQIRLAKHRQFGASSEKTEEGEQLGLFDEAENIADPKVEEKGTNIFAIWSISMAAIAIVFSILAERPFTLFLIPIFITLSSISYVALLGRMRFQEGNIKLIREGIAKGR